jgi:hypothetical protein
MKQLRATALVLKLNLAARHTLVKICESNSCLKKIFIFYFLHNISVRNSKRVLQSFRSRKLRVLRFK